MIIAETIQGLPDPNHFASVGWVVVILVAVVVGLNTVLDFYKNHMKEKPTPSMTYVAIPRFEEVERHRKEDRDAIKKSLEEIKEDLKESKTYQEKARQKIHGRLNAHENALYFMAGQSDPHASRVIRERLEQASRDDDN